MGFLGYFGKSGKIGKIVCSKTRNCAIMKMLREIVMLIFIIA